MRLIHNVLWSDEEIETFRHQVFNNITFGLKQVLEALEYNGLNVLEESKVLALIFTCFRTALNLLQEFLPFITDPVDIRDGQPFPIEYLAPLRTLWQDANIQMIFNRANDALPEKYVQHSHIN